MKNSRQIQARLIPIKNSKGLSDLESSFKQIRDIKLKLLNQNTETRSRLARKLKNIRSSLFRRIKTQTEHRETQLLENKLSELAQHIDAINKSCYRDALNTIKAVCIKVFSENTAAYDSLLQLSLDKAFKELDPSKIIQVKLPKSVLSKYQHLKFKCCSDTERQAVIISDAGRLRIDPILDLQNAFENLNYKLEESLER